MQDKNRQTNLRTRRKAIILILFGLIATVIPLAFRRILVNPVPEPVRKKFRFRLGKYIQGRSIREPDTAESLSFDLDNGVAIEMVSIPSGRFEMGSPDSEPGRSGAEGPQHSVIVSSFLMSRFPVTQALWEAVANLPQVKRYLNPKPSTFDGLSRPVETISWEEAVEFCDRLTERFKKFGYKFRLPSEAEWEYACRANTTTPFYFGETITPDLANYDVYYNYDAGPKAEKGNKNAYKGQTTLVNRYDAANTFGLADLHGNVWEWCADSWHPNYVGAPVDGRVWNYNPNSSLNRVLRGGAWHNFPTNCRSASRNWKPQNFKSNTIGFRVACNSRLWS